MTKAIQIACEGADVLSLDQLEPFQGELKELSEEDAKRLTHEILTDGFSDPFNVWRNEDHFYLIDGHQRRVVLYALEKAGYEIPALPVVWVAAESFEQAKRKVLAQAAQYGRITFEGLSEFIEPFPETLSLPELETSFRFPELDMGSFNEPPKDDSEEAGEMVDKAAKLLEKWGVERGQIWEIPSKSVGGKSHRVMCGDSTDAGDVALLMDGKKADVAFADPMFDSDNTTFMRQLVENTIGAICVMHSDARIVVLAHEFREMFRYFLVHYYSFGFARSATMPQLSHHLIAVFGNAKFVNRKDGFKTVICEQLERGKLMPYQKKVGIPAAVISHYMSEGIVLDPFLGSGTTVVAAEQETATCYGMEISEQNVAIILERLSMLGMDPRNNE